jgi:hypothetical protein
MSDQFWQTLRYILIGGGMWLAGYGKLPMADVASMADEIISIASAAVAVGTAAWGLYVKFRTKAVPERVAARPDVPTVSAATGEIER